LRQGTQFSKATLSPDNKDALANKELPGTVSTDAPEAIYKSRLRKRKVINYTEVNKKRKVKNYTEVNGTDDSPDTESAQLATNDSIDAIDMTMEYQQAITSLPPPSNKEYDVVFPVTPHGLLFVVSPGIDGSAVFREYSRYPDGSKGPAASWP
jgi:hypothetical protein